MIRNIVRVTFCAAVISFCLAVLLHLLIKHKYNHVYVRISQTVSCIKSKPNVNRVKTFQEIWVSETETEQFAKRMFGLSPFEEEGSNCHLARESLKSFCSLKNAPERMALSSAVANCHLGSSGRPTHKWDPKARLRYANESFMAVVFHFLPLLDNICDGAGHGHMLLQSNMDRESVERLFNALEKLLNYTESVGQEQTVCDHEKPVQELKNMERACYATTVRLSEHNQECKNQLEKSRDFNDKYKGAVRALQEDHQTCVRDAERLSIQHKHCETKTANVKREYEECKGTMQRVVLGENKTREELMQDIDELKEMISVLVMGTDRCFSQLNNTNNALLDLKNQDSESCANTGYMATSVHTLSESMKSVARNIKLLQNTSDITGRKEPESDSILVKVLNGYYAYSRSRRETKKEPLENLVSRFGSFQGLYDLITSPLLLCMYLEKLMDSENMRPEARDILIVAWILCQILFLVWMLMVLKWSQKVISFFSRALKRMHFVLFGEQNKVNGNVLATRARGKAKKEILSIFKEPLQSLQAESQETAYLYHLIKQEIELIKTQPPEYQDIDKLIAGISFLETKITGVRDEVDELARRVARESLPLEQKVEQDKPLSTESSRAARASIGERPRSASRARAVSRLANRNGGKTFAIREWSVSTAASEMRQTGASPQRAEAEDEDSIAPVTPLRRSQRVLRQREMSDKVQENSKPKPRGRGVTPKRKAK